MLAISLNRKERTERVFADLSLLCETVREKIAARLFVDPSGVSVLRPFIYLRTAPFGPNQACNCRIKVAMSK
jgi:hypothetical protein